MAGEKQPNVQIVWHQIAVIERFSSVLYPLDVAELLRQLPTIGYVVPEPVSRGTIEVGRPLATKGDTELVVNTENKTIGVRARDPEQAVASFRELREFCVKYLDPSPGLATHYLEFTAEGWAKSNGNPTEVFARFWANYAPLGELGKLLGSGAINFGVQLVPLKDPNDPNWFHIFIEPLVVSSNRRYRVMCIWRETNIELLLKKLSKVDETLEKLILRIES